MLKKKKYVIGGVIVLLALGFLGFRAFAGAATYYLTVNEVFAKGNSGINDTVRVEGTVLDGSVERESAGRVLKFSMSDNSTKQVMPVVYSGVVPDTFKVGTDAVVEGKLDANGVFQASVLMTKCPAKYEPVQPAASTAPK